VVVVIVIAAVAVIAVVVLMAVGRGGQLSAERGDYLPIDLGPVSATDVVLLRPPTGLWGYNMQATDEAMERIADSIRERDVRIVALEQLVTDLSRDHAPQAPLASPYAAARHRRTGELPAYRATEPDPFRAPALEADPFRATEPAPDPLRATGPAPDPLRATEPAPDPFRATDPDPDPDPFRAVEPPPEPYRRWEGEPPAPVGETPVELPPEQAHD
jgi:hypothetical protein